MLFILYCRIILPYIFILYFSYAILSNDFHILCFSYTVLSYILLSYTVFSYTVLSYTVFSHTFHILYLSYTFRIIDTLFLVLVYLSYTFLFHIMYLFIYFLLVLCTFHILSYTVLCPFHILSYTMYFSYTVLFHILSYCTFNCILSSHSSVMLLISCHILYTYHFLLGFMSAYTLEADTGNNCMYP